MNLDIFYCMNYISILFVLDHNVILEITMSIEYFLRVASIISDALCTAICVVIIL